VVYDKQERTLTLVRDQLGIKPLYYWHTPERTVVSSLLRTVVETAGQTPDLDYQALSEYVRYQFTFGDKTFFNQVKRVLPGHVVRIHLPSGELRSNCYEDILNPLDPSTDPLTPDTVRKTNELIVSSCQDSTISDTSFTTFCSGGLDSSLITAITRPDVAYHCNYKDPDLQRDVLCETGGRVHSLERRNHSANNGRRERLRVGICPDGGRVRQSQLLVARAKRGLSVCNREHHLSNVDRNGYQRLFESELELRLHL
jgi:asparagine synthase (glutamine-hydrolysing)